MRKASGKALTGLARWHRLIAEADLPSTEKLVLFVLAGFVDWGADGDGTAFPGVGTLAGRCGLTRKGVQLVLRRLRERGVLSDLTDRRGGRAANGRPKTCVIQLHPDRLAALNREPRSHLSANRIPLSANHVRT